MTITVVSATGSGRTKLSAFDNALKKSGVFNYNIIQLSSVIPTGTHIIKKSVYVSKAEETGFRLYVVKADIRSTDPDTFITAGLGWYQFKDYSGVFVEHELEGHTAKSVEGALTKKIATSLADLCQFRGEKFSEKNIGISIAVSNPESQPRCALTLAIFKAVPWETVLTI